MYHVIELGMLQIALESDAEVAYARLGALCQAIKNELQNDLNIHDASILPAYVNLPQVTAAEYSQVPTAPSTAVDACSLQCYRVACWIAVRWLFEAQSHARAWPAMSDHHAATKSLDATAAEMS